MTKKEFRAILDWFMCSDPWPVEQEGNHEIVKAWLNYESNLLNYPDWVDAYHKLERLKEEKDERP